MCIYVQLIMSDHSTMAFSGMLIIIISQSTKYILYKAEKLSVYLYFCFVVPPIISPSFGLQRISKST